MRLTIWLLQKFPFNAEPGESVGSLKSRLQDLIGSKLSDAPGSDSGLPGVPGCVGALCCGLKVEVHERLDIHLVFKGVGLTDDAMSLAEAGLIEGSEVTVLSRGLALRHAAGAGIRSVGEAFKELAESGEVGAEAELAALKNSRPFPLRCELRRLGELGAGWTLFFELILYLVALCVFLFVAQLPAVLTVYLPYDNIGDWPTDATDSWVKAPISRWALTPGNTGPDEMRSQLPGLCAFWSSGGIALSVGVFSWRQRRLRQEVDSNELEPSDFAVFVSGLPADATDDEELRAFITENACANESAPVVTVVVCFEVDELRRLSKELQEAKEAIEELPRPSSGKSDPAVWADAQRRLREAEAPFQTTASLRDSVPGTGHAVAVLRRQVHLQRCIEEWDTWREYFAWVLPCARCISRRPLFRGQHNLRIRRAEHASDYIWEHIGMSNTARFKARLKAYATLTLITLACFFTILFLKRIEIRHQPGAWFTVLFVVPVPIAAKVFAPFFTKKFVAQQRHVTKTKRDLSLSVKYTLFNFAVFCILPLCIWWRPDEWYDSAGLFGYVWKIMLITNFAYPATSALGIGNLFRLHRANKVDLAKPPAGMVQFVYRTLYEPPAMAQENALRSVLKTFSMGIFFLPFFPLGMLITCGGLVAHYWACKYQLLRLSKRPYRQSHKMATGALWVVFVGAALLSITQFIFLRPSLDGVREGDSLHLAVLALRICAAFLVVPLLLRCASDLRSAYAPGADSATSRIEYYTAQRAWPKHQKYHTTHPFYLKLELIAARAARATPSVRGPLPWDPRTGNFPEPGGGGLGDGAFAAPGAGCLEASRPETVGEAIRSSAGLPPSALATGGVDAALCAPSGALAEWRADPAGKGDDDSSADEETGVPLRGARVDEDAEREDVEETAVVGGTDAATLALEEAKYRLPLAMVGGMTGTDGVGKSEDAADSESSSSDESDSEDSEAAAVPPSFAPVAGASAKGLKPGMLVTVSGLRAAAAQRHNGATAALLRYEEGSEKWVVSLSGETVRVPAACLVPFLLLSEGDRARIQGLSAASGADRFNGSTAELLMWDKTLQKWHVRLFTGNKATIPAGNLGPLAAPGESSE